MGLLRTYFAISVMLWHGDLIDYYVPMLGPTAVESFYVLSGFYIALVYNETYSSMKRPLLAFYLNRYLRLAPLYLLIAAITLYASQGATFNGLSPGAKLLLAASHVFLVGQDLWVFLINIPGSGLTFVTGSISEVSGTLPPGGRHGTSMLLIPQGWSIGLEIWFYLAAPFIVRRQPAILVIVATVLTVARFIAGYWGFNQDPWSYRCFPFELPLFLIGALAYHFYLRVHSATNLKRWRWAIFAGILTLALLHSYMPGGKTDKRYLFTVLLAAAVPFVFSLTKEWRVDRLIGDLSYPIYIIHILLMAWIPGYAGAFLTVLASVIVAVLLERPLDRWRHALPTGGELKRHKS